MAVDTTERQAAKPKAAGRSGNARPGIGKGALALIVIGSLVVGGLGGAFLMRQRQKARDVVVSVNGQNITKDALLHRMELAVGAQTMRAMVQSELQIQFAKSKGLAPTDAEVEARYKEISSQPGFEDKLNSSGQSASDVKQDVRVELSKAAVLGKGITVTDADARAFYDVNASPSNPKARYYTPEVAQAAIIVTTSQADIQSAARDLAKGMSFEDVARHYSKESSKQNGGLVPPFQRGRSPFTKFAGLEAAIFQTKVGSTMGPSQFGGFWWIVRCMDRKPAQTRPFDSVKEECRIAAKLGKGQQQNGRTAEQEFQQFQQKAVIQAFWPQYRLVAGAR